MRPVNHLFPSALMVVTLSACGGAGSDESAPASLPVVSAPTPTPTPAPSPSPTPTPAPSPSSTPTSTAAAWKPRISDTWQWQLRGTINTRYDVTVYDIDLADTPQATIDALHARGTRVICYFSAGSSEDFRSDYNRFNASDKGEKLDGWPGERWLDVRSANVRSIMRDRLNLAAAKKCDGVEPDNVDGYANANGFRLTAADQSDYNRFLANEAHSRGLMVGLKNDLDQIAELVSYFDFAVNEQCHEFDECAKVQPFVQAGKPVFNAEYKRRFVDDENGARTRLCASAHAESIRSLVLPLDLDDKFRYSCD